MAQIELLRVIVSARLSAAAEEIFGLLEKFLREYEEGITRQILRRYSAHEDFPMIRTPDTQTHGSHNLIDPISQENLFSESPDINVLSQIKLEQEDLWSGPEADQGDPQNLEGDTGVFKCDYNLDSETDQLQEDVPPKESLKLECRHRVDVPIPTEPEQQLQNDTCLLALPVTTVTRLTATVPTSRPKNWLDDFQIPWERMPHTLLQAIASGDRPSLHDRRKMVRIVVGAIQVHCVNPSKAQCTQVAKAITSRYPKSFADLTKEGDVLGTGFESLLSQIKMRVKNLNRSCTLTRLRRPRRITSVEDTQPISFNKMRLGSDF